MAALEIGNSEWSRLSRTAGEPAMTTLDFVSKRLEKLVSKVGKLENTLELLSKQNDNLRADWNLMYEALEKYANSTKPLSRLEAMDVLKRLRIQD